MIINPIIPIWFMTFICLCFLLLLFYNSKKIFKYIIEVYKEKKLKKSRTLFAFISKFIVKILIIILLFLINLRFMLPNGEVDAVTSDLSILFVIDTSVSMRALDYNGENERFKGVINDCEYILDNLPNSKYSIITFGDTARRIIPFTTDVDIVKAELKAIQLENDFYAKGTSLNLVKNILEKTVKDEYERQSGNTKTLVFFISDGEITIEGEKLEDFSAIKQYIVGGAILGYGTNEGGKMVNSTYEDKPTSEFYYIYYYDDDYNKTIALSKIDENNLNKIANDLNIDYINMNKTSNIDNKISDIKKIALESKSSEEKKTSYIDIYYYFAIPLLLLLCIDSSIKNSY